MKKVKFSVTVVLADEEFPEAVLEGQMRDALYSGRMVVSNRGEYVAKIKVKKIEDHLDPV